MTGSRALVLLGVLVMASETRLEAYLDPGSGSMLVQLLLGGTAGLAVILRLGWRRLLDRFGLGRSKPPTNPPDE
jgi:hypothetical protein